MFAPMKARVSVVAKALRLMTKGEAISGLAILALMSFAGLIESAIVALVVPIAYVIADPERVSSSRIGAWVVGFFGVSSIRDILLYLMAAFMVLLVLASLVSGASRYLSEAHAARCVNRMARSVLQRCLAAPYAWLMKQNTSMLVQYILDDVSSWRSNLVTPMFRALQALIMIVSPVLVAVAIAPVSALVSLAVVGLICVAVVLLMRKKLRDESHRQRDLSVRMRQTFYKVVHGILEIRISQRAEHFLHQFDKDFSAANWSAVRLRLWNEMPANLIMVLGQLGFLLAATVLYLDGKSGGEITAQLALLGVVVTRVLPAFNRLIAQVPPIIRSMPYVQALLKLDSDLNAMLEASRRKGGERVPADWGQVAVQGVWYRYEEQTEWTLKDVSLVIEKGKFYGLVGRSGSGKTTLANLILGLLEPVRGDVKVCGKSLEVLSVADWQRRFGYVPQNPFVMDGSLIDNIEFGEYFDEKILKEAIEHSRLMNGVGQLPAGLQTAVGERGQQLSGGQMQRLAIARALVREPAILLLDEATSALDNVTETEFQEAVRSMRGDITAIMIAHRLTTLQSCDCIFVLDKGEIVASGSYDELLEGSPVFRALAKQSESASMQPV